MTNKILLLDYGGVLGYDHLKNQEDLLAHTIGLSQAELDNRTSEKSDIGKAFRENKITEIEFWRKVTQNTSINRHFSGTLTKMWMDTYCLNDSMMKFLQELRKDVKVGVLTNIDIGRSRLLEKILDINKNLDYYFPSYAFGYSKDSNQLWNLVNEKLPENYNIIYVDDRIEHVLSAEKVGWKGIHYNNFQQLKKQLNLLI
jgi:FMN phosphatase YigB (HAD superfamily)